jgi:hypothetical protein
VDTGGASFFASVPFYPICPGISTPYFVFAEFFPLAPRPEGQENTRQGLTRNCEHFMISPFSVDGTKKYL